MLLIEYDYATDIEVQREEAFEKGIPHIQPQLLAQRKRFAKHIRCGKNFAIILTRENI